MVQVCSLTTTLEGKAMQNETISRERLSVIAKDVAGLVDFYGWKLSSAKAAFKNRTGIVIKARSKDDFVNTLRNYYL